MESHILTTLQASVQRLVLIGDHKQLRPKVECYRLRKESGNLIDFDESLFERLALQPGFPVQVLNIQHRMRPEISAIVRQTTYPELKDQPSVEGRPEVRGLAGNVQFITHTQPEQGDEDSATMLTSSKVNMHECGMVVGVAKYLLQQGYAPCDVVVLTPYLGQLAVIQRALGKLNIGVAIGDNDRASQGGRAAVSPCA